MFSAYIIITEGITQEDFYTPTSKLHEDLDLLLVKNSGKLSKLKFVVDKERDNKTPVLPFTNMV